MRISAPPSYKKFMLALTIAGLLVIASMLYVANLGSHVSLHGQIKDTSNQILLDMSIAHLWLEESVNGNAKVEEAKIKPRVHNIQSAFQKLKKIKTHRHAFLTHPELDELEKMLERSESIYKDLAQRTTTRLNNKRASGIGSKDDQAYDRLFKIFNQEMSAVQGVLTTSLNKHLTNLRNIEITVAIISFFILFYTIFLIKSFIKQQRKHYEDELTTAKLQHAAEKKYRALIEQSPFAIQVMSPEGDVLHVNEAWEDLWKTTKDLLGQYNLFQDPLIQASDIFDGIKRGFAGESIVTPVINLNPSRLKTASPLKNRFVRVHIYPIKDIHKNIEQVVMIYADVTETYRQNCFQLGHADVLKKIVSPSSTLHDTLTALTLFIEKLSPNMMASILLLDESGKHLIDGVAPSLDPDYLEMVNGLEIGSTVGSCGTAAFTKELVIVSNIDSDPLWEDFKDIALGYNLHACWSQPILDSFGHVLGTLALYSNTACEPKESDIDILQRASHLAHNAIVHKRSMGQIAASEEVLKEAQKLAHLGSWERSLVNETFSCSDEICRIFQLPQYRGKLSYQALVDAIHPGDFEKVLKTYQNSLETELPCEISYRLLLKHGHIKYVNSRFETSHDYHGNPIKVVGTVQDITALVEAQKEKEKTASKMEHVQRLESLGVLAGGIAHDFNNILTAILGNAELARSHMSNTSEAQHYIEHIAQASQKAANLCKQMLAYSGKGRFVIKPIDLSELVEELSQLLHVTIAKNVVLRLDLSQQLPAIDADITQMQQVIMNLVINASEAISGNSGSISISTGVVRIDDDYLSTTFVDEDLETGLYIYLEVSDTGCGMNEETHARIFEPFFTTKFTGRGLGMAAILGIIRGHHGAIKSYSEVDKGTTFKAFFPASSERAIPVASGDSKPAHHWQNDICVLVIDDEETIREVATSMLHDMGLKTMVANDGVEGVELFKQHHKEIGVVLMDMTMPRMSGEDAFTELCRINPDAKVILSSGYTEQDATNRFAGKGLAGFLQKPYTLEELSDKLSDILQ